MIVFTSGLLAQQKKKPEAPPEPVEEVKKESTLKTVEDAGKSLGSSVDPNSYELGAEDVIYVSVWHDVDFSRGYLIRPDGKISLQLVGEVLAAGKTPKQLAVAIAEKLATLIKDPQVDVSVVQVNSKAYFIQGGVMKPGKFPLGSQMTVLEALTNSGGFKEFANTKKIFVLRKGERLKFNYKDVVKGKKMEQNILLKPGDYIIVPD